MESGTLYVRNLANTDWVAVLGTQGPQGYQGATGTAGTPGGPQGDQGYQGPSGSRGTQGTMGYQGYQGYQGNQGYQGRTGTTGAQGFQGYQGYQGHSGIGFQGPQGYQGRTGTQGFQGYQGYQGDFGGPQGYQGDQGYQGVPGTGSGGGHVIEDEGTPLTQRPNLDFQGQNVWVFDDGIDTTQVIISGGGSTGPQGYQGPTGAQGYQGYQGHTGMGYQGYQGHTGAQGTQGYQGHTGVGVQGYQGSTGAQGSQGYQGATGSQGFQGYQGYQGHTGMGYQGYQGDTGTPGSQGYQGYQGHTGMGFQGYQGDQGYQGNQGLAGSGSAHVIRDETTPLTQRSYLSFKGENIWAVDNAGADSTDVIVSGSASAPPLISGTPNFIARFNGSGDELESFIRTSGSDIHFSNGRIYFGTGSDVDLYRYQDNMLMTDDDLFVLGYIMTTDNIYICHVGDKLLFGDNSGTYDVNLYRTADGHLITDNRMAGQPAINSDEFMTLGQYTGSQGPQGYQGATGAQGYQGATGSPGSQGYQGATGSQGYQGYQGYTGSPGAQGYQGATGTQGSQGYQGATGSQGSQGYQGSTGSPGPQGYQGVTGAQGPQGVPGSGGGGLITGTPWYHPRFAVGGTGLVSSYLSDDSTGGSEHTNATYPMVGPAFVAGDGYEEWRRGLIVGNIHLSNIANSLIIKNSSTFDDVLISSADLRVDGGLTLGSTGIAPPTDGIYSAGRIGIKTANPGYELEVTGSSAILASFGRGRVIGGNAVNLNEFMTLGQYTGAVGVQGPQGPTGSPGPQGYQGHSGVGFQGYQGYEGATGSRGYQGYQGHTGVGVQGYQGATGAQGAQGYQGATGSRGATGSQGPQGYQGHTGVGVQGYQGATGAQGFQGYQGYTGSPGPQGYQGYTGAQGYQGYQGHTGSPGPQGYQGSTGSQGSQGYQGYTGSQGYQGYQGETGSQGPQGNQGVPGSAGTGSSIGTGEFVGARYTSDAGQLFVNNTPAFINFEDKVFDTHTGVTIGSGWKFTAPYNGYYLVNCFAIFAATGSAWGGTDRAIMTLYRNGTGYSQLDRKDGYANATVAASLQGSMVLYLSGSSYVQILLEQNSGVNLPLSTGTPPDQVWIDIARIEIVPGAQGYQGATGSQGAQGYQGVSGGIGPQGYQGDDGGGASVTGTPFYVPRYSVTGTYLENSQIYNSGSLVTSNVSMMVNGGLFVGYVTGTPVTDDIHVESDIRAGGGLVVGTTKVNPSAGEITLYGPNGYIYWGNGSGFSDISLSRQGDNLLEFGSDDTIITARFASVYGIISGYKTGTLAQGDIHALADGRFGGGLVVGATTVNPGEGDLFLEGGSAHIYFGTITGGWNPYLYRSADNWLTLNGNFYTSALIVGTDIKIYEAGYALYFGDSAGGYDTLIYRGGANKLRTPDDLVVDAEIGIGTTTPNYKLEVTGSSAILASFGVGRVIGGNAVNDDEFVTKGQITGSSAGITGTPSYLPRFASDGNSLETAPIKVTGSETHLFTRSGDLYFGTGSDIRLYKYTAGAIPSLLMIDNGVNVAGILQVKSTGIYVGGAINSTPFANNSITVEGYGWFRNGIRVGAVTGTVTTDGAFIDGDVRVGGGLYVGQTIVDPAVDTITADGAIYADSFTAGYITGTPTAGDIHASRAIRVGGGLVLGSTKYDPSSANLYFYPENGGMYWGNGTGIYDAYILRAVSGTLSVTANLTSNFIRANTGFLLYNTGTALSFGDSNANYYTRLYQSQTGILKTDGRFAGQPAVNSDEFITKAQATGSFTYLAPTAYTVGWSGSTANPSIGNGVLVGRYSIIGKRCFADVHLIFGSTTSSGRGNWIFSLPVAPFRYSGSYLGIAHLRDAGTNNYERFVATTQSTGSTTSPYVSIFIGLDNATNLNNIHSGSPFNWGAGDSMTMALNYEIP